MLSIEFERCRSKGKVAIVKARVGASTAYSVYANFAFGIQSVLLSVIWMPSAGSAWSQIRTQKTGRKT